MLQKLSLLVSIKLQSIKAQSRSGIHFVAADHEI
jgi:hypothetical protein